MAFALDDEPLDAVFLDDRHETIPVDRHGVRLARFAENRIELLDIISAAEQLLPL